MNEHYQQKPFIYTAQAPNPPPDITRACFDDHVDEIQQRSFQDCHELLEINLNDGLQVIGDRAFRYCRSLRKVSVPSTVWRIGHSAFLGCGCLVEIDLLEGLREIGELTFLSCRSLQGISIPSTVETIGTSAFAYCQDLKKVSLKHGMKVISKGAFEFCVALTDISIPSTVEIIGISAFSQCQSLATVNLQNGLQVISACAFESCVDLSCICIPSSVHTIESLAFFRCQALIDVELTHGLVYIGAGAFTGCTSLCSISIPYTTTEIGGRAFKDCTCLLGVEFSSSGLIKLGDEVFRNCVALVNISLPATVAEIPKDLFSFCPQLQRNTLDSDNPDLLQERYANLPVHEACYQVSRTPAKDLKARLTNSVDDDTILIDAFGMTPFHIIATSDNRRKDLLELLLDHYPFEIISQKDRHERTMMDYMIANTSPRSIPMIQKVLKSLSRAIMSGWCLDRWRTNIFMQLEYIKWNNDSGARRREISRVLGRLVSLVQAEVTSILELVLWKIQINAQCYSTDSVSLAVVDRESCRTTCKADNVITNVVGFLWSELPALDALPTSYCMISMDDIEENIYSLY